jgi:G6PDH family F420-dependent oxidoreductase
VNGSTDPDDRAIRYGLTLSSEEHPPARLVEMADLAERTGFDFVSISDHYHPWIDAQGHSPFVWSVLGAVAERTSSIDVAVGVTCPTVRIHPAILAQATATCAQLLPDRFVWGVGSGEALNEHVLGDRWPSAGVRLSMLREAIEVVRELWAGDDVTHRGEHYTVENARLYDPPPGRVPIVVSAFGPKATELAAEMGDGLWVTGAAADTIERWRDAGGDGPVYSQLTLCWAPSRDEALATAHRIWPTSGVPGQLSQDLPTPAHFEQAVQLVTPELLAESVPCGPDPAPVLAAVREMRDAGVDHVYFHQIGPDQDGFVRFWSDELAPELSDVGASRSRAAS